MSALILNAGYWNIFHAFVKQPSPAPQSNHVFFENLFNPCMETYLRAHPAFWNAFYSVFSQISLHECKTTRERLIMYDVCESSFTRRLFAVADYYPQLPPGITTLWLLEKFVQRFYYLAVSVEKFAPTNTQHVFFYHRYVQKESKSDIAQLPNTLYHGTTKSFVLTKMHASSNYTDFGHAFYVTNSAQYAADHAEMLAFLLNDTPIVIEYINTQTTLDQAAAAACNTDWETLTTDVRENPFMHNTFQSIICSPIVANPEVLAEGYIDNELPAASKYTQWAIKSNEILHYLFVNLSSFYTFPSK